MKRVTKTVWQTNDGHDLLEKTGPGEFYIPCTVVKLARLEELAEALNNAVALERMNRPSNGFAEQVTEAVAEEAALRG